MMIEKLNELTDKYIVMNKDNTKEIKKYQLIKEIINKKDSFLNMDIEYAYSILRDLGIEEKDLKKVYIKLI